MFFGLCLQSIEFLFNNDSPCHADTEGQKIALFQFIAKNYKSLGITWSIIADALHDIDYGDLSSAVRGKYCTIARLST